MLAYKEQQALEALLVCSTRKEAALMAGITEKTLRKYINDAEFQREYKAFYRGKLKEAARKSQAKMNAVMETFYTISQSAEENTMARIAAGRAYCEYSLRMTEITDILEDLEGEEDVLC